MRAFVESFILVALIVIAAVPVYAENYCDGECASHMVVDLQYVSDCQNGAGSNVYSSNGWCYEIYSPAAAWCPDCSTQKWYVGVCNWVQKVAATYDDYGKVKTYAQYGCVQDAAWAMIGCCSGLTPTPSPTPDGGGGGGTNPSCSVTVTGTDPVAAGGTGSYTATVSMTDSTATGITMTLGSSTHTSSSVAG